MNELSKALTWEELADIYDKEHNGRPARTLSMESVLKWAEKQKDKFIIKEPRGTLHKIIKGVKNEKQCKRKNQK